MGSPTYITLRKQLIHDDNAKYPYIDIGNGDVIMRDAFVEALKKTKTVKPGSIVVGHDRVEWSQSIDEAVAKVLEQSMEASMSVGFQEESFLKPDQT